MSARSLVVLWLPPLALMGVIFVLSAQPDLASSRGLVDFVARKILHAGEYGVLCLLWWRALRPLAGDGRGLLAAFAISVAYAASDELHQSFVAGRIGTPIDVGIDALGAAVAGIATHVLRRRPSAPSGAVSRTPGELRATASRAG